MFEKIKNLVIKYREALMYLIFGGLTTVVDFAVSFLLYRTKTNVHVSDVAAWCAAVAFAYVTNKIWVFESRARGFLPVVREITEFAGGRVLTLLLQEAIVWGLYDRLKYNKYAVKIAASVIVVILNYFISKLIVFRKGKSGK